MSEDTEPYEKMGEFAYGFFKSFLKEKRESLSKFFAKQKVGFVPLGFDYSVFQKLQKKTAFKQLKFLVGNHHTLPIVTVGLWINSLDEQEQLKIAEANRDQIYKKYKEKGVNILNMGTTGFMEGFIKFLTNYALKKNPSKEEMIDIYEKTLEDWSNKTIFVQKTNSENHILHKCRNKIDQDLRFFYMFASYEAIKVSRKVVENLVKDKILQEANYEVYTEKLNIEGSRKVWIFEKQD